MIRYLLFIFLAIGQFISAQSNSIFPQLPYSDLGHIAVEGDNIFAAGDCGIVLISTNDGEDWTTLEFDKQVRDIQLVPGSNGQKALLLTSIQIFQLDINTETFTTIADQLYPISGSLSTIQVNDSKIYVTAVGGVFQCDPKDYIWTKVAEISFTEENDWVSAASLASSYLYIGSNKGEVIKVLLSDGTTTRFQAFIQRIYELKMVSAEVGYAYVAAQNTFSKTTDGGQTWSMLTGMPEGINPTIYGTDVILSINTNRIYISLDGGLTSTHHPISADGYTDLISAAYMTKDGILYMSGRSSMVLKSTDFGATLEHKNRYRRADLQAIDIHENGIGYAVGYSGSVVKTTDGGESWAEIEIGLTVNEQPTSIVSYSDGRLVIGHDQGVAIINNDMLEEYQTDQIDFLIKSNSEEYLIGVMDVQGGGQIVKSTDRGATWEAKIFIPRSYVIPYQSPTGKLYVAGDENVFVSVDDGETWTTEDFGHPNIRNFSFINDDQGIFVSEGNLYKTENGGQSSIFLVDENAIYNVHYLSEDRIFFTIVSGRETITRISEDGGASFTKGLEFCSSSNGSFYDGDNTIWLAQKGGHINKYVFENSEVSSAKEFDKSEELLVSPNPVVSGQVVNLGRQFKANSTIEMYNNTGQQIMKIGVRGDQIQLPQISAGYYLIRITEEGKSYLSKLIVVD